MPVDQPSVLSEDIDDVMVVTLNRPERRNAINSEMNLLLNAALERFEASSEARVMVLIGAGSAFCAGRDLHDIAAGAPTASPEILRRQRTKPVIAAVNGPAVAGGFEIALACDLMIAADDSTFALPESHLGLLPAGGAIFRLVRRVGSVVAHDVLLSRRSLTAAEALQFGIVSRIAPSEEIRSAALAFAQQVAAAHPAVTAAVLRLSPLSFAPDEELWEHMAREKADLNRSLDARRSAQAFVDSPATPTEP